MMVNKSETEKVVRNLPKKNVHGHFLCWISNLRSPKTSGALVLNCNACPAEAALVGPDFSLIPIYYLLAL